MKYYEIAVNAPIESKLTYHSDKELELGSLVSVPLGRRTADGIVWSEVSAPTEFESKSIKSVQEYKIDLDYKQWIEWISQYYHYPLGLVSHLLNPKSKFERKSKQVEIEIEKKTLTANQLDALKKIDLKNEFRVTLLHGVTGSGKTEVYMELFDQALADGRQGLFLVPEISLTPQLEERFKKRFGHKVSTFHSQMTPKQRSLNWHDFNSGETKILLGPRSALFCPAKNLGVIILDEEHESSFKQEDKFLYHARDAAIKLAHIKNIPVILGSATPSLESIKNVTEKKFQLVQLKDKVFNQDPPSIEVVDMRSQKNNPFWLSQNLKDKIENHLARKNQAALFLNRRGWSSLIQCYDCGFTFMCPNCDVSLTLHDGGTLFCHYCSYGERTPKNCPSCESEKLSQIGLGTEQIENDLKELFPHHRVKRIDRDEITTKKQLAEAISQVQTGEVDILIGTQMIAKGLDFPNLTLMGVVDADLALSLPDFRASERGLQQIIQVLGRVGRRKGQNAEVVIQTRSPENSIFQNLEEANYLEYSKTQLNRRQSFLYPPYNRIIVFLVRGSSLKNTQIYSERIAFLTRSLSKKWDKQIETLGPAPAPIEKLRNEYRIQILVKMPPEIKHQKFIAQLKEKLETAPTKTRLTVNVDPIDLM